MPYMNQEQRDAMFAGQLGLYRDLDSSNKTLYDDINARWQTRSKLIRSMDEKFSHDLNNPSFMAFTENSSDQKEMVEHMIKVCRLSGAYLKFHKSMPKYKISNGVDYQESDEDSQQDKLLVTKNYRCVFPQCNRPFVTLLTLKVHIKRTHMMCVKKDLISPC
ncbi:hypothetical protein BY458DRAFT_547125 [Sporodiniella umbellata]|nr:hypothetical protein BY458DRAFT_547125 [Sporodiniella umbellata]